MLRWTKGKVVHGLLVCAFLALATSVTPPAAAAGRGYHHETSQGENGGFASSFASSWINLWRHIMQAITVHLAKPLQAAAEEIVNGVSNTCK